MKAIDIALKDIQHAFRSWFALVFMFVVPVLITGMFYFMFGGASDNDEGFNLPRTQVQVVNLYEGAFPAGFTTEETAVSTETAVSSMGDLLIQLLQDDTLAEIVAVTVVDDVESAKAAVDTQAAGVAVIIPANFTDTILALEGEATIDIYQDPTLTLGPGIVKGIFSQFMDGFSGTQITQNVTAAQLADANLTLGEAQTQAMVQQYQEFAIARGEQAQSGNFLNIQPANEETAATSLLVSILSPIMAGMIVFYAFFTGVSMAQTIITEEEQGTLQRLFTTPTTKAAILSGKFLAASLTVVIQVIVLLLFAGFVFGVAWGSPLSIGLAVVGIVASASTFGLLVMSFVSNSKQAGVVYGGVVTLTGMLAMIPIFTANASGTSSITETIALLVPQGWALRGLRLTMNGETVTAVLVNLAVILGISVAFFFIGRARLRRRFA
jgi:ABC-2 type transport system permease protein